jgi:hypothetical protein
MCLTKLKHLNVKAFPCYLFNLPLVLPSLNSYRRKIKGVFERNPIPWWGIHDNSKNMLFLSLRWWRKPPAEVN